MNENSYTNAFCEFTHILVNHYGCLETRVKPITTLLKELYNHPRRAYHNVSHLDKMLTFYRPLLVSSEPNLQHIPMVIAVVFHDAIYTYTPQKVTNEQASANLMTSLLMELNEIPSEVINVAHDLIIATDYKKYPTNSQLKDSFIYSSADESLKTNLQLIRDLDLAGFSDYWDCFWDNTQRVREEMNYHDLKGMQTHLDFYKFLYANQIYSPKFLDSYPEAESEAKRNLKRAISIMQAEIDYYG